MTAEPVTGELPKPTFLSVGETPIYLSSPLEVNGQQVTQLTIKGTAKRAAGGIDRPVMVKYGITDIRMFYNGDLRLVNQF